MILFSVPDINQNAQLSLPKTGNFSSSLQDMDFNVANHGSTASEPSWNWGYPQNRPLKRWASVQRHNRQPQPRGPVLHLLLATAYHNATNEKGLPGPERVPVQAIPHQNTGVDHKHARQTPSTVTLDLYPCPTGQHGTPPAIFCPGLRMGWDVM